MRFPSLVRSFKLYFPALFSSRFFCAILFCTYLQGDVGVGGGVGGEGGVRISKGGELGVPKKYLKMGRKGVIIK